MYVRSFHQGQWEHKLFPALGEVLEVSNLLLSGSSLPGFKQFSLKHVQVSIRPKTGGPPGRLLETLFPCYSLVFGCTNSSHLSLSESSPLPRPLSETPGSLKRPLPNTQPGNCF